MKRNGLLVALLLGCLSLISGNLMAQYYGIQTENDGFRWERVGQNGKEGAKNVNGSWIIPLSRGYSDITYFVDANCGGYFGVWIGGRDGKEGVCDKNGKEIIAPKYKFIFYTSSSGFNYKDSFGNYIPLGITMKNGTIHYTSTSSSTTSSSSSSSGTTSGSGNDKGLLYKGEYTICRSRQYDELTGNPMGISASDETQVVEIYEDHVYLGVHYCEYQSTNNRGERVYKDNLNKDATLYVSPNFDIRYYWSMTSMYGSCNVVIPVEKGTSYMSSGNGGYSAPQQSGYNGGNIGGNNGGNSGSNTSTSSKTHKCSLCNGTGRVIENNATSYGNTKYCSECGKTVPDYHYHTTCPSCNGKGYW